MHPTGATLGTDHSLAHSLSLVKPQRTKDGNILLQPFISFYFQDYLPPKELREPSTL